MDVPLNNFKGVMLCNRPNDNVVAYKEKPFCSRVQPSEQWGLSKKAEEQQPKPILANPVLERHKKWLEEFKLQNQLKKHAKEEAQVREEEKFIRVREQAKKDREVTKQMKEEYRQMNEAIKKELNGESTEKMAKLTSENLKKLEKKRYKQKPVWAMSKEEEEEHMKQEEDDLLNFVENLDYDSYMNDLEVKVMVKALQQRVGELKKDEAYKEKIEKMQKQREDQQQEERQEDMYDKISQTLSKNEDARTVQSEKTQNSIQQLRKQQEELKKDWDNMTQSDKRAPIEDRIAKHVADEILRQYRNLNSIHSNSSIRKILEREAKKTLQENGIAGPVISTIKNEKKGTDPNTLPYLHRNPAI